jgi:two-component system alkaline phosphatase synthesis response regulator PhoP
MRSVLIIEDNSTMLRGLKDNFELKGYSVRIAQDGETGLRKALGESPDLIILDIMLPKINGYEVCNKIRKKNLDMPIIMLTAKDRESDVILGLNLGADDYVTKPFSVKELLARAEAFMRRRTKEEPVVYEFGNYSLDTLSSTLTRDNEEIKLTPGEFKILHLFLRRAGCTLTCDEIRNNVWGYSHFITLRDIENAVKSLRNKIEDEPDKPKFIHAVEVIGYKFILPEKNGNDTDS